MLTQYIDKQIEEFAKKVDKKIREIIFEYTGEILSNEDIKNRMTRVKWKKDNVEDLCLDHIPIIRLYELEIINIKNISMVICQKYKMLGYNHIRGEIVDNKHLYMKF